MKPETFKIFVLLGQEEQHNFLIQLNTFIIVSNCSCFEKFIICLDYNENRNKNIAQLLLMNSKQFSCQIESTYKSGKIHCQTTSWRSLSITRRHATQVALQYVYSVLYGPIIYQETTWWNIMFIFTQAFTLCYISQRKKNYMGWKSFVQKTLRKLKLVQQHRK